MWHAFAVICFVVRELWFRFRASDAKDFETPHLHRLRAVPAFIQVLDGVGAPTESFDIARSAAEVDENGNVERKCGVRERRTSFVFLRNLINLQV